MSAFQQILSQLEVFRDPATEIEKRVSAAGAVVRMVRDGEQRTYFFDPSGSIERRDLGRSRFVSFASLLASSEFADLAGFADTQRRIVSQRSTGNYLEPAGIIDDGIGAPIRLDMGAFLSVSAPSAGPILNCILIDGPAGVGKTTLLERLVSARAQNPLGIPVLHVTSRGRRLTNLRDAFAGTTTGMRAKFVPDEIPILVKNGLLQVALDGFDEFVDPSGYQDAWGALKDFIRECGAAGPIILAGRDTFFDQQKFERQLTTAGGGTKITMVRLHEVTPETAKSWLAANGWSQKQLSSVETQNYLKAGSYMLRPFFLSRIKGLRGWDALRESRQSPQSFVIDEMVLREAKLLSGPLSLPFAKVTVALNQLFENIAEDMAEREVDSVPLHYLTFVAEYAFSDILDVDQMSRLRFSLGTLALLEPAEAGESVRFPHTEIQNRFLVRGLIRQLAAGSSVPLLGRAIFGMDRVEAFAERIFEVDHETAGKAVAKLQRVLETEMQSIRLSLNVTALLISSLCNPEAFSTALTLENVAANDVRAQETLGTALLSNVTIARLDARNGDLSQVKFENCSISTLISDGNTRFGGSIPNIDTIHIDTVTGANILRADVEKSQWLGAHSPSESEWDNEQVRDLPLVKHFDRICRRFVSQVYIRDNPNDQGSFLLRGDLWDEIKEIMLKFGRLRIETKQAAGQKDSFYHMVTPERLLSPAPDDVESVAVRQAIAKRARELSHQDA